MRRLVLLITFFLYAVAVFSQAPQKMSYQVVIRNSSNALVTSSTVGMQVSILQGSISGTEVYKEIYSPNPQTNVNGLVTLEIGSGTPVIGSFATIDWSAGSYFIKTEIDPLGGTSYTISGTTQLLSVPYSLYSETAGSVKGGINETDPVFINHAAHGITSTNISNWNTAYSWGNHAGLYSLLGHTHPYLPLLGGEMANTNIVTNLNADLLDGQHGSFYAPSTGSGSYIQNQNSSAQPGNMWISGDSKIDGKIYVNGLQTIYVPNQSTFDASLVIGTGGLNLTNSPPNSPWPQSSGLNNGKYNTFVGIEAGRSNTSGNQNTFVGSFAGYLNTIGDQNTFIGMNAGINNTTGWHNTFMGAWAGQSNTTGNTNSFLGTDAGNQNTTGSGNSFFGQVSGFNNTTGNNNTFFGATSGANTNAEGNSFFGKSSGFSNTNGSYNTYIGNEAGFNPTQKTNAVNSTAIGNGAFTTSDNQVVIGNNNVSETLLSGNLRLTTANSNNKISFYSSGTGVNERARIAVIDDGSTYWTGELAFYTENSSGTLAEHMRINKNGNIGIGYSTGIEISNNKLAINGSVSASSYKLGGTETFLNWTRTGYAGSVGQILISNGSTTAPAWTSLTNAGIAPFTGSPNYIQNQNSIPQTANMWISGDIKTRQITVADGYGLSAGNFGVGGISGNRFYIYNGMLGIDNISIATSTGITTFNREIFVNGKIKTNHIIQWGNGLGSLSFGTGFITLESSNGNHISLLPSGSGNVGIGYYNGTQITNNKLAVNGSGYFNGIITANTFNSTVSTGTAPLTVASTTLVNNLNAERLNGQLSSYYQTALTNPITGQGTILAGYIPKFNANLDAISNSPIYTDGTNIGMGTSSPMAKLDVIGSIYLGTSPTSSKHIRLIAGENGGLDYYASAGTSFNIRTILNNNNIVLTPNGTGKVILNGNIGVGYSDGPEIANNKLAVNGDIYTSGLLTANGGKSTDWNTAYGWGNHAGLYRPISYVPSWSEITSNPFAFSSVTDGQLLKYNSATAKWENWTPNSLATYNETDPVFAAWDKTSGITINTSQISDFQIGVTNNAAVLANTAKNSYPIADATKLAGIAAGAEVNVNADWNATSGDAQILNRPTIPVGTNQGDMQYWNGTAWVMIPAGQPGQFLQFTTENKPAWTTALPILTTTVASSITNNSAISGGNIASSGGGTIIARGVCWSTSPNPTLSDNKTTDGTGTGTFISLLTYLTAGTTYYLRAYATNSSFTAYGNELRFITTP